MDSLIKNETRRIKFRLLRKDDFDTWLDFFKDSSSVQYMGMADIGSPTGQCEKWFELCEKRYINKSGGLNVIVDKATNKFIGQCGLLVQEVDGLEEIEIGYSILPQYRGMGYATEAAKACRDYAFSNNIAETLISIIHVGNIKSEKVATKNGMIKTKRTSYKGMPVNIFRIDKETWQALN